MTAAAEKTKWKCIDCDKEFEFGQWECFPGVQHKVAEKTYYLNDAPHCDFKRDPDGLAFRTSRNQVYVLPHKRVTDETGTRTVERPPVLFIRGRYMTADAEEQYFIDRAKIDVGYDRWFEAYHTPTQKANIKGNSLDMREHALKKAEANQNQLLEDLKKLKEQNAALEKAASAKKELAGAK